MLKKKTKLYPVNIYSIIEITSRIITFILLTRLHEMLRFFFLFQLFLFDGYP